jgi:hypothetical protein
VQVVPNVEDPSSKRMCVFPWIAPTGLVLPLGDSECGNGEGRREEKEEFSILELGS